MSQNELLLDENTDFYYDCNRLLAENKMLHQDGYFVGASNSFARIFTSIGRYVLTVLIITLKDHTG
jgi:hypothetical protein